MKPTIAVLLGLLLALTACGSQDQPAGAEKDEKGDSVQFAKCMRENGIDMPDPESSDAGVGITIGGEGGLDPEKMKTAHEACKKFLPNGGEFKPPSPEDQDKIRKQAKCMRDKGHSWPEPKFGGGPGEPGEPIELPDMEDEKVKQDMKECGIGDGGMIAARPVG